VLWARAREAGAGRRAARTVHAVPPRKLLARLDRVGDVVHLAVAAAREPLPAAAAAAALLPLGELDRLLAAHPQDLVLDRELLLNFCWSASALPSIASFL